MDAVMVTCAVFAVGGSIVSYLFFVAIKRAAEQAVSFADDARLFAEEAESERRRVLTIKEEMEQRVVGLEAWAKSLVEKLESEQTLAKEELRALQADCGHSVILAADKAKQVADIAEVVKLEVAKIETLIAKLNKDRAENPPFVAITYGEESGEPEKAEVSIKEKEMVDDAVKYINEQRDEILKMLDEKKKRADIYRGVAIGHLVVDKDGRVKSCGTQEGTVHSVSLEPQKAEVSINEKEAVGAAVERVKECRDEIIKHVEGTITTTIKGVDGVLRGYTVVPLSPSLPTGQPFEFKPTQVHPVVTEGGE